MTLMIALGYETGLFEAAAQGAATSQQLADRAGLSVESIPTGHCPFLAMPKLLADQLLCVNE